MKIEMTGAEWLRDRPGGLNRYFQDLFVALSGRDDCEVNRYAFGFSSRPREHLGPAGGELFGRMRSCSTCDPGAHARPPLHASTTARAPSRLTASTSRARRPPRRGRRVGGRRRCPRASDRTPALPRCIRRGRALVPFRDVLCRIYGFPAERVHVDPAQRRPLPLHAGSRCARCGDRGVRPTPRAADGDRRAARGLGGRRRRTARRRPGRGGRRARRRRRSGRSRVGSASTARCASRDGSATTNCAAPTPKPPAAWCPRSRSRASA